MSEKSRPPDPEAFLRVEPPGGDLKHRTARNAAITVGGQWVSFVLALGGTMVLARLLTPEDFGLIAMVLAVVAFFSAFRDLGLSVATVRSQKLTHAQASALFWITLGMGGAIGLTLAALAPLVSWFYAEPRLTPIVLALAVGPVFSGVAAIPMALLRRRMAFGRVVGINLTSLAMGLVVGVGLAWMGWGYRALVAKLLVEGAVTAGGAWLVTRWRPAPPRRTAGLRPLLAFGSYLSGSYVLSYFARNLDNILIGRVAGSAALGVYTKAYQVVQMPLRQVFGPISSAVLPAFSRLQDDPVRFRAYYRQGAMLMASLGMPLVVLAGVAADRLVLVLLGAQWLGVAPLLRMLAPAAFVGTFYLTVDWVYLALGATRRQFRWTLIAEGATVIAFLVGIRWGPPGVAAAYSLMTVLLCGPGVHYAFRATPIRVGDLAGAIARPAVASLMAGAVLWAGRGLLPDAMGALTGLLIEALGMTLLYAPLWYLLPGGRDAFQVLYEMRSVWRREESMETRASGRKSG